MASGRSRSCRDGPSSATTPVLRPTRLLRDDPSRFRRPGRRGRRLHLGWPWPFDQRWQIDAVSPCPGQARAGSAILAGDMNATPWSETVRRIAHAGRLDADAIARPDVAFRRHCRKRCASPGCRSIRSSPQPGIKVHDVSRLEAVGSDHLPLLVQFSLAPDPKPKGNGETATAPGGRQRFAARVALVRLSLKPARQQPSRCSSGSSTLPPAVRSRHRSATCGACALRRTSAAGSVKRFWHFGIFSTHERRMRLPCKSTLRARRPETVHLPRFMLGERASAPADSGR